MKKWVKIARLKGHTLSFCPAKISLIPQKELPDFSRHTLKEILEDSNSLVLDDGACFSIHPTDFPALLKWKSDTKVRITPNTSWFSSYNYLITNTETSFPIRANVAQPTKELHPERKILALFRASYLLVTDDGFLFGIKLEAKHHWSWNPKETVIIGDASDETDEWNKILINPLRNEYVLARAITADLDVSILADKK